MSAQSLEPVVVQELSLLLVLDFILGQLGGRL